MISHKPNHQMNHKKVAIIGAGIGGLATAVRLSVRGYDVQVFEANPYPGGKLTAFAHSGFRFDAGPSLFTLPHLVDELFEISGKNPRDYLEYVRLDEICRYFWEDGSRLTVPEDIGKFAKEAEKILGEPGENIRRYLADSRFKYEVLSGLFLEDSLHKFSTWFSTKALKGYLNLHKMGIFGTLNQANEKAFKTSKAIQLFNRYATYNGSDPYQTPATMSIIPHLEYNTGAFFPKNGMHDITLSLYQLAKDLGVVFHFNEKVCEIIVKDKKANGVRTSSGLWEDFDAVVSNMDVTPTYRRLLPGHRHPDRTLDQPKSGSGLIFYWGVKKEFKELGLHNIFFSDDYKTEFEYQFSKNDIYEDPTIYLNITSKQQCADAPEGSENWFVLLNAPANHQQDWQEITQKARKNVITKLSRILGCDIAPLIVFEEILDPVMIELQTSSDKGALYGNSSNNKFAAFLRHANFSKNIQNLYFVGGSVHPGGGIPLALSSAKITAGLMA